MGFIRRLPLREILERYPATPTEMINRALLNLAQQFEHPCDKKTIREDDYPIVFARKKYAGADMNRMMSIFQQLNYIELDGIISSGYPTRLTPHGWAKIEELKKSGPGSRQAFVAMSFDPGITEVFDKGIKPGIEEAGDFGAYRIDREDHNERIDDRIIAEIRRSRFLVADFTHNRGGVYFEAGFALGLGLPVIWIANKKWEDKIHFDTRQYNHIFYDNPEDLCERLKARIQATIL